MDHFHRTGRGYSDRGLSDPSGTVWASLPGSVADRCRRSIVILPGWIYGVLHSREAEIRTLNSVAVDHVLEIFDSTINNHRSDEDECDAYHHPLSRPPVKHDAIDDCRVQLFTCFQPHKVWCV